ncbi:hypothetical protein AGABI2DRAFT_123386 [Agaricus bisporus var. bisporus H97]|uniref:hypothetical protein n=1 Tax=Agaricus bisporus var. bisporus (strain H97 / ATCC MYA-4626 / FGSC 10389) TaxID=936046 RepID=UPI00029F7F06|nr:hypothetical protein AGABI2DRAFT_123386 [Agaricus bisporus var. bisporus H97]EKV41914.1 hypothetical protein AGABI2DRAFT_123386 [Agaricus bisporus var. bisporus H97]
MKASHILAAIFDAGIIVASWWRLSAQVHLLPNTTLELRSSLTLCMMALDLLLSRSRSLLKISFALRSVLVHFQVLAQTLGNALKLAKSHHQNLQQLELDVLNNHGTPSSDPTISCSMSPNLALSPPV